MKLVPHRGPACLALLAVFLLVSCRAPSAAMGGRPASGEYALCPANVVFDLEREGLKVAWRQELGASPASPLVAIYSVADYLVAEAAGGQVHVFDAADYGKWKAGAGLPGRLDVPPAALGSRLFLTVKNRIFSLDVAGGKLIDPDGARAGMAVSVAPLVYQDALILAGAGGDVARHTIADNQRVWIRSVEGAILDRPVIDSGTVYASAQRDRVIALDLKDGQELWQLKPAPPARLSSGVAVYGKTCYVGDNLGTLYGLNAEFGNVVWTQSLSAPVVGAPKVVGDKVLVFTNLPRVTCLRGDAGPEPLWTFDGAVQLVTSGPELAYFLTDDNAIAAVTLEDGKELWRDPLPEGTLVAGSTRRPEFYIADAAGSIVAIAELE